MTEPPLPDVLTERWEASRLLPHGAAGIDAGLTLTKTVVSSGATIQCTARLTENRAEDTSQQAYTTVGVAGARAANVAAPGGAVVVPELDAAARGATALMALGGQAQAPNGPFLLALLGTGTAFAVVRDGGITHLGGTPLGGGSFAGIARRLAPTLSYNDILAAAARGDRHEVDVMVADAYPEGIGRISPELTAAHLAAAERGSLDDVMAALLNLHGENIAQIAGSRARMAGVSRIVLCGGFVHENPRLVASIAAMTAMFGVPSEAAPHAAWAGAIGAALMAAGA